MKMVKKKVFVVLAMLVLCLVILVALFLNNRKNSNYPVTQPDFSQDRTIQENGGLITVNFEKCTPDIRRIDVTFGSTTIEVRGKEGNNCLMYLGGEVENPNYDGRLGTKCKVPLSLGIKEFTKGQYGVGTSSIQQYCSNV